MANEYIYPDINDQITLSLINKTELIAGSWEQDELSILAWIKEKLSHLDPDKAVLLDGGCGDGRLLPHFHSFFKKIYAIDPDSNRLSKAAETSRKLGIEEKVVFINAALEECEFELQFDVIISSHIIQHVQRHLVDKILSGCFKHLKPGGYLFLMTSYSTKSADYYVKDYFAENNFVEEEISPELFDSMVSNSEGILPVHFFSRQSLVELFQNNFLVITYMQIFHNTKNNPNGRDIFVAAEKPI
ncbi:Methyltransferase type 11 [Desulfofarcimen acetoxidans DSM 771]|uniref:Methyltransferase type 11 n=1 Tax=Desulfofarcimen acetoxidans (strain ATCC 49208 / DSM 771 / KCTC 5769 / VKM B-1644 / 5575) TaxID=485916 RepID=C8VXE9_DESAS|nr:class I SAM-dependent methyltransferase [Desulfofarcimen acetoxidans]ACV64545.1 Methyltransferase type 11 [Desulfofarcimen acetoxidans DSM 771]